MAIAQIEGAESGLEFDFPSWFGCSFDCNNVAVFPGLTVADESDGAGCSPGIDRCYRSSRIHVISRGFAKEATYVPFSFSPTHYQLLLPSYNSATPGGVEHDRPIGVQTPSFKIKHKTTCDPPKPEPHEEVRSHWPTGVWYFLFCFKKGSLALH